MDKIKPPAKFGITILKKDYEEENIPFPKVPKSVYIAESNVTTDELFYTTDLVFELGNPCLDSKFAKLAFDSKEDAINFAIYILNSVLKEDLTSHQKSEILRRIFSK